LPGLAVSGVDLAVPLAKFDLQLALAERVDEHNVPQGMSASFTYATDRGTARRTRCGGIWASRAGAGGGATSARPVWSRMQPEPSSGWKVKPAAPPLSSRRGSPLPRW
ncbi:hypothetical protein, partial [Nocardia wallacei]|uniref:hypothetical protein n=1 Tax=Nocardia wallacei TaxID=480035 RepID=UPI002454EFF1